MPDYKRFDNTTKPSGTSAVKPTVSQTARRGFKPVTPPKIQTPLPPAKPVPASAPQLPTPPKPMGSADNAIFRQQNDTDFTDRNAAQGAYAPAQAFTGDGTVKGASSGFGGASGGVDMSKTATGAMYDGGASQYGKEVSAVDNSAASALGNTMAAPQAAPATEEKTSEDILKLIPSKKQISEMSREELINLKNFLIKHCYQEAMQTYDIYNVKRFAKECFKTHNMIPVVLNQYYPDVITDNIQAVYNKLLELSNTEGNGENIRNAAQTQLDYTMKLFSNSTDWIGIVLSKKLGDWSPFFRNTVMENMTIGKFFMAAALCASIVYLVKKFFKSKNFLGIGDKYDFSDSTNREYFDSKMKNFKEDVDAKLNEYMTKDVPTDILMINSIILKAEGMALGLLLSVAYQNLDDYNIPLNILVLTEICCAMVLLWGKLLGRKLKKAKSTSNLYDVISDKLSISMGVNPNNPSRDIFSKLNKYSRSLSDEQTL